MDVTVNPDLAPVLEFRSLKPYDRYEVEDLHARLVGTGLENTLEAVFDDENAAFGIVATEGETVVGYGIVLLLGREATADYFRFATVDLPIGETNAVMHALAVEESWQGRGIGSELLRLRLAVVRDAPAVDAALGNAWLRPHTGDVSVLFEKHGFERYETVDGSFRQSEGSRDCPDCGPDGCDCSTAVYAKTFDDESSETDRET